MVLDMEEGTLSFIVQGTYLGKAFTGLKGKKVNINIFLKKKYNKKSLNSILIPFKVCPGVVVRS